MASRDLIPTAEAAEVLGVNRSTLIRWVQKGRLAPAMTVPGYRGHFLFDPDEIDRLVAEREERIAS
ncbi:helix-turn-helix domain-containing protein [Microbacterium sp. NEAU-LLC]|uniref:Helix-turn-helix domain-containing protein n=1 Tax=Microbacterium helvum TaxID=2773713 RepID=A0ABR8NQD8_9MICO|nr:helix-turn-helix domain-containing protein [Microbacterium helvum]MBD3941977.1 helix-turn-helix domain-containing protein [Microbacterium helvum]